MDYLRELADECEGLHDSDREREFEALSELFLQHAKALARVVGAR